MGSKGCIRLKSEPPSETAVPDLGGPSPVTPYLQLFLHGGTCCISSAGHQGQGSTQVAEPWFRFTLREKYPSFKHWTRILHAEMLTRAGTGTILVKGSESHGAHVDSHWDIFSSSGIMDWILHTMSATLLSLPATGPGCSRRLRK